MKSSTDLFIQYTKSVLGKTVLWVFLGLDGIGFIVQYLPLVSDKVGNIVIPPYLLWLLPVLGFYWASFQVYQSDIGKSSHSEHERERDINLLDEILEILPSDEVMSWMRDYDFGGAIDLEPIRKLPCHAKP